MGQMGGPPRNALKSRLVENMLILSGLHVFTYIFPLITIPFLARVLGPTGWGVLAFYQAFGAIAVQVMEYGFDWSATREIARNQDSAERRGEVLSGVVVAKCVLAIACVVGALIAYAALPQLRREPALVPATLFWAIGQAANLNWYFQGMERMRFIAGLSFVGKAVATASIFVVVDAPADGWKVLALNGIAAWLVAGVALVAAARGGWKRPSFASVRGTLKQGWTFFVFQGAASIYTLGNAFILGLFAAPRVVGFYAAAEKVIRLITSFINPVVRALYPRVGNLVMTSQERAAVLVRRSTIAGALASVAVGAVTFVAAPAIVGVAMGSGFEEAVPLLRIMSLLPVAVIPGFMLGSQWMLPLGYERPYVRIVLRAGAFNLALALLLAPTFAATGMAVVAVATEAFVAVSIFLWLSRRSLDPLFARPAFVGVSG